MRCRVTIVLLALLVAGEAWAHARHLSRSRWRVRAPAGVVGATLSFEGQDLQDATGLDRELLPEGDPKARAAELERRIYAGLDAGVKVTNDGEPCEYEALRIVRRKGFEVGVRWDCGEPLGLLRVELAYLGHMKPDHRHLARFSFRTGHADVRQMKRDQPVFEHRFEGAPEAAPAAEAAPSEVAPAVTGWGGFVAFFREGVLHIATGWDHILFLLALLALGGTFGRLAGIVTAFTVAHSITLASAYLGLVDLPARLVESVIAASIVFVALENLWLKEGRWRWVAAFGFGLIHGFGFAGFLTELDMGRDDLVATLLGFNLGVEAGQLAVVLLAWPLIRFAQSREWHRRAVVVPLSLVVAALGAWWFVERAFALG